MRVAVRGRVALAVGLVLVASGAAGCGGGGHDASASKSASQAQFCGGLKTFQDGFADVDPTKDIKGYVTKLKEAAQRLDDIGTPSNISADARAGFKLTISEITSLPDDATIDDLSKLGDVSDADQKKLTALGSYISKECPNLKSSTDGSSTSP